MSICKALSLLLLGVVLSALYVCWLPEFSLWQNILLLGADVLLSFPRPGGSNFSQLFVLSQIEFFNEGFKMFVPLLVLKYHEVAVRTIHQVPPPPNGWHTERVPDLLAAPDASRHHPCLYDTLVHSQQSTDGLQQRTASCCFEADSPDARLSGGVRGGCSVSEEPLAPAPPPPLNVTLYASSELLQRLPHLAATLVSGGAGSLGEDVYRPPIVVYVHGGGHAFLDAASYDRIVRRHANAMPGAVIASLDYRMSPLWKFPTSVYDVAHLLEHVHSHAAQWGCDPGALFIVGDSAGGALTAASFLVGLSENRPFAKSVRALGVVYGEMCGGCPTTSKITHKRQVLNGDHIMWLTVQYLRSPSDVFDWRASPLFAPDALLQQFPHTYSALVNRDPLYDEALAFHHKLQRAKRAVDDSASLVELGVFAGFHGAYGSDYLPGGTETFEWVVSKINPHILHHAEEWDDARRVTTTTEAASEAPVSPAASAPQSSANLRLQQAMACGAPFGNNSVPQQLSCLGQ